MIARIERREFPTRKKCEIRIGNDALEIAQEVEMVALVKDNGEFTPMPVVRDTEKFKKLSEAMEKAAKPTQGLVDLLRVNGKKFVVRSR